MQPIQWTERPTGALVAAGSLWPDPASLHRLETSQELDPIILHGPKLSKWT
jgi:hypothetical protein